MAERDLSAAMLAAIAAGTVRPALFYEGEFVDATTGADDTLRLWTGVGTYVWNSLNWTGGGRLMRVSIIEETQDLKAVGFSITMSGMPSADIRRMLGGVRQNKPGKLWLALFDAAGALIADPYLLKRGLFNVAPIADAGSTCTIEAQYEDRLISLERARERRYTPEDQQIDYPDDHGFDQVTALQELDVPWNPAQ
jgi:hypothetical protein